jgi:hypothetical protein
MTDNQVSEPRGTPTREMGPSIWERTRTDERQAQRLRLPSRRRRRSRDCSLAEAFNTTAYEVVTQTASRFRVCLECGRPFIAGKGQEYCTTRCSQAVRTRRFTAKHGRQAATGRKKT